jgi:tRNA threonylcarbamoyl adenosine modification protein (Sua5/YciO/YrdC/YwlC family)
MIEYIVSGNIDDRILANTAQLLQGGGIVALPTDTSWSVVCSFKSAEGIKRLKKLSGVRDERYFTLLCADISQAGALCSLDNSRFRLIKRLSPGPYVFILKTLLGTEKVLGLRRKELGVRIPDNPVPVALVKTLGNPLYSVTAKRSMLANGGEDAASANGEFPVIPEEQLFEGGWEIDAVREIDMILDPGEDQELVFSTVLDLSGGDVALLRAGAGAWPPP